jgi:methyl-accepting chemotaxis protein
MMDIVGKIRAGEQLVRTTNQEFVEMKTSSHKVVELMGSIALASQEQSQGIDQINTAIQQMNSVTQENAASAQELAAIMATFITESGGITRRKASGGKRFSSASRKKRALSIAAPTV